MNYQQPQQLPPGNNTLEQLPPGNNNLEQLPPGNNNLEQLPPGKDAKIEQLDGTGLVEVTP